MRRLEQIHTVGDIDVSLVSDFVNMIIATGTMAFTSLGSPMGAALQGGMVASFATTPIINFLDRPARIWAGCDPDDVGFPTDQHPSGAWLHCEQECQQVGE